MHIWLIRAIGIERVKLLETAIVVSLCRCNYSASQVWIVEFYVDLDKLQWIFALHPSATHQWHVFGSSRFLSILVHLLHQHITWPDLSLGCLSWKHKSCWLHDVVELQIAANAFVSDFEEILKGGKEKVTSKLFNKILVSKFAKEPAPSLAQISRFLLLGFKIFKTANSQWICLWITEESEQK